MREAFRTESSEEFMSLVYALDAEAGGPDEAAASAASLELEWTLTGRVPAAHDNYIFTATQLRFQMRGPVVDTSALKLREVFQL